MRPPERKRNWAQRLCIPPLVGSNCAERVHVVGKVSPGGARENGNKKTHPSPARSSESCSASILVHLGGRPSD